MTRDARHRGKNGVTTQIGDDHMKAEIFPEVDPMLAPRTEAHCLSLVDRVY